MRSSNASPAGGSNALPAKGLIGPIAYGGSPLFPDGEQPRCCIGKIRRVTRSKGALGVFGVPVEKLERSFGPAADDGDWRETFDEVRPYAFAEGGGVYLADGANGYFVVTRGGAADLLNEEMPSAHIPALELGDGAGGVVCGAVCAADACGRIGE